MVMAYQERWKQKPYLKIGWILEKIAECNTKDIAPQTSMHGSTTEMCSS